MRWDELVWLQLCWLAVETEMGERRGKAHGDTAVWMMETAAARDSSTT